MQSTIKLLVWGDYACFTRPDLKTERVTYECMTPSAARGVLDAIHWKPAIRWVIDRIHVLKPIKYQTFQINEVKKKSSASLAKQAMNAGDPSIFSRSIIQDRAQRSTLALRDVSYVIEAHFEMTDKAGQEDTPAKHASMFRRRASAGQCYKQPCLGLRDFSAAFELVDEIPTSELAGSDRDLGLMLYGFDFETKHPSFFRARLENGVLDVAAGRAGGLLQ